MINKIEIVDDGDGFYVHLLSGKRVVLSASFAMDCLREFLDLSGEHGARDFDVLAKRALDWTGTDV